MNIKKAILITIFISSLVAGALHIFIVADLHRAFPPERLFFIIFGIFQVVFSFALIWRLKKGILLFGFALHGGLIALWVLTRVAPAPFVNYPESIEAIDIVTISFEIIILLGLAGLYKATQISRALIRTVVAVLILSVASGASLYAFGMYADDFFPELQEIEHSHGETKETPDEPQEDENHNDASDTEEDHN